jgi:glycosyltransferase involved in cell wall biosynthesis
LLPALLRRKLVECDVIVADFPFVHPIFRAPSGGGSLRVLSTHNLEHRLYDAKSQWRNCWVRPAVRAIERRAAEACDVLVSCCDGDRRFFEANARVRRSIMVPNGIDPRRFRDLEAGARAKMRHSLGIPDDVRVFLFTASKFGPNREAFDYLAGFARDNAQLLVQHKVHILVVGNVTAGPVRAEGFSATGKVDVVEPYFAAADCALNPMWSGAGTNVKMCEFIAARLPILTTRFGARGFLLEDGDTAFLFERDGLGPALLAVCRLLDEDPARLRRMADDAYARNRAAIDMDECVAALAAAMRDARVRSRGPERAALLRPCPSPEARWLP